MTLEQFGAILGFSLSRSKCITRPTGARCLPNRGDRLPGKKDHFVVINYLRTAIVSSAVSLVAAAAYDAKTDRLLVLDVARYNIAVWVKASELFDTMNTRDATTTTRRAAMF